jgi:hypothetical protein
MIRRPHLDVDPRRLIEWPPSMFDHHFDLLGGPAFAGQLRTVDLDEEETLARHCALAVRQARDESPFANRRADVLDAVSRFFGELTPRRLLERLSVMERAAWRRPIVLPRERAVREAETEE